MYKICHVTCVHQPEDGRIFRRACISTAIAGYDTYLVEKGDSYEKAGVHIIGIGQPKRSGRLYRMAVFARKAYKTALKVDADIYQLHDPELLRYAAKLKRHGKCVVFDCHENYFEMILRKNYYPFHKIVGKQIYSYMERVLRIIDGITYPAEDSYYLRLKSLCKRTCVTGNYPWKSELYDKYDRSILKEKKTACYIGSLTADHGIIEIIKACYNAGFKLYLAGPFYSASFKKQVFSMKEFGCVEYLGVINREEVLYTLQKTEIGLCVLHNTGQYYTSTNLSTKVYECMAMGIPVILNNSPYNVRIVEKLHFGICVDPMNIDEISDALLQITNDDMLKLQFGENGRKASSELFCWDQEQENLISMYRDILNQR